MMPQTMIPVFKPFVPQESLDEVIDTLKSSWIGGDGPKVKKFERKIGRLIGNSNVIAVNSGTSALHLALRLAGVAGGEVISTPMTCFATNAPVVNEGAKIVWADIDPETGNIDPTDIARKITRKTKAIVVVHWGGNPCDMQRINKLAKVHKIPVIEDAAQALGSEYEGKFIGNHSDYVCVSTQAIKLINTADGGLLLTRRKRDLKRARRLRWYGIDRQERKWGETFWHYAIKEAGFKMQMTDVSAAIGLGQLAYLRRLIAHRRRLANIYKQAVEASKALRCQRVLAGARPNYWMFTLLCGSKTKRLKVHQKLKKIRVMSLKGHNRNDIYPVFRKFRREKLTGVTLFNDQELVIPNGYWVSIEDANRIAQVLASF